MLLVGTSSVQIPVPEFEAAALRSRCELYVALA